ncbi:acyl-CoA thioesterase [Luteimonas aestuarii]|uniref:Acyl-CoA thioesterase n=1 Tax=Luteimonas aestuarii TaxID=453837 RepID=A0A4R5TPL9_9GAMM|nr:acyl-CoA thioesterase [Luteimonas aestuarii]TDK23091.1 acyl-CoA thioesterase [Luteimonas aestuarii]
MPEIAAIAAPPTEARLLHMVFPDHTNHLGTLFGGQALAWMDMAAFIAASRYARSTVVTARSEQVDFNQPIHKGDLVEVVARIAKVGRSSMHVEVEVITENLLNGERKLCTRGKFVMIALDPLGQPTPVPSLPAPSVAVD